MDKVIEYSRVTIKDIYQKYDINIELQKHHLRVAALSDIICSNWLAKSIDRSRLITAALLHDIGNLVKFDLKNNPNLLGEDINNLGYWVKRQRQFVNRYGSEDEKATRKIIEELGLWDEIGDILEYREFIEIQKIYRSNNNERKVLEYANYRIMPNGVSSLSNRLREGWERYRLRMESQGIDISEHKRQYNIRRKLCFKLEQWVESNCDRNLQSIKDKSLENKFSKLLKFSLKF